VRGSTLLEHLSYLAGVTVESFVAARDRLLAADRAEQPVDVVVRELLAAMHEVSEFDRGGVLLTDPETLLPFGGIVEGMDPSGCVPFWDNELLDPDFAKFTVLAQSTDPVASLSDATDGDLDRSPRFCKMYKAEGAGDELRVAFRAGSSCWAVGFMLRPADLGPFSADEVQGIRDLVPLGARAVRAAVIRRDSSLAGTAPAVLIVSADGSIESTTADTQRFLEEFSLDGIDLAIPTPVIAAARRAKNSRSSTTVTLRARGLSGGWFRLHASPLGDDGRVAVVIEPAPPADLVPILLESYGLTQRESEIVPLLARGLSTKQIAAEMCISRHTVSDYMKLIFEKCGVGSRGELVAKIFTDHVLRAHKAATGHL
jgi:DNA-binding CsgD family transcriptional regulator